jgi:hypothetical protein
MRMMYNVNMLTHQQLFIAYSLLTRSRDFSVGIATDWTARARFPEGEIIFFPIESRAALGPIQTPSQYAPGANFLGDVAVGGVKLTTHLQPVLRSRMMALNHHPPI